MKFWAAIPVAILAVALAGVSWWRASLYSDRETLYRTNLAVEPNSEQTQGNLGLLLTEQGHLEEALEHFQASVAINPRRRFARGNLATAYYRLGRYGEAAREFEAALVVYPNDPDLHNNFGATLFKLGRTDDAIREYLAALGLTGHCTDAWINLLDALASQQRQADVERVKAEAQKYAAEHSQTELKTRLDQWVAEHR